MIPQIIRKIRENPMYDFNKELENNENNCLVLPYFEGTTAPLARRNMIEVSEPRS